MKFSYPQPTIVDYSTKPMYNTCGANLFCAIIQKYISLARLLYCMAKSKNHLSR